MCCVGNNPECTRIRSQAGKIYGRNSEGPNCNFGNIQCKKCKEVTRRSEIENHLGRIYSLVMSQDHLRDN